MFTIEMMPANEGDALWIEYGADGEEPRRILIDCGRKTAYRSVRDRLKAAAAAGAPLTFELFVISHVDDDHIYGAVCLLGDDHLDPDRVEDVWFNEWRHLNGEKVPPSDALGPLKGEFFAGILRERRFNWNAEFCHRPIVVPADGPLPTCTLDGGMQITLLSPTWPGLQRMRTKWYKDLTAPDAPDPLQPGDWEKALEILETKSPLQPDALGDNWLDTWNPAKFHDYATAPFSEDKTEANGSSIAMLAEYEGKSALLCGDAHPTALISSIDRLRKERGIAGRLPVDAVKLPHHGSARNTSDDLLSRIRCKKWMFSTNGGTHHHPDPEAVARIITAANNPTLFFNFDSEESRVWRDSVFAPGIQFNPQYGDGYLIVPL